VVRLGNHPAGRYKTRMAPFLTKDGSSFLKYVIFALDMAELAPRHAAVIRITHWINSVAFLALAVSGAAILVAHPRLYWGETGAFGSPALVELPLPLNLDQSGWGRSLHFLAAWLCVVNGAVYVLCGSRSRHFTTNILPARRDISLALILEKISDALHLRKPSDQEAVTYNVVQRMTYLTVVFVFFPLMIVTGLAMSPALSAVLPAITNLFGGYQSSRTIHFFLTTLLVLFLIVHLGMVALAGFWNRTRAMITGHPSGAKGNT